MERFICKTIPLSAVIESEKFCCRRVLQDKRLEDSVRLLGVLIPPILVHQTVGFEIVAGYKRIEALRVTGARELSALVIAPPVSDEELFMVALISNMNQVYRETEQLRLLRAAKNVGMHRNSVISAVLPSVGLEPSPHVLDIWERRLKLAPAVQDAIYQEEIPCRNSEWLDSLDAASQFDLVNVIRGKLSLTASQLKQTCEWLGDLLRGNQASVKELLRSEPFQRIFKACDSDKRAAADRFMSELFKVRYPGIQKAKEHFREAALSIQSEHVQIVPPEDFEDEGFTVKMRLRNQAALDAALDHLEQKKSLLRPLFDFMI